VKCNAPLRAAELAGHYRASRGWPASDSGGARPCSGPRAVSVIFRAGACAMVGSHVGPDRPLAPG
jgi:hypothetical protein